MVWNQCRWVRRRLAILAGDHDGRDLVWDDRRRVERHLIACSSCRAERSGLESAVSLLRASALASTIAPDAPSIWPALSTQIHRSRHPRRSPLLGLAPALGLAASFVVVGGVIGLVGWTLGSASALRPSMQRVESSPIRPRPALPEGPPRDLVVESSPASIKPEMRASLDLDPKTGAASNPRDPQRSQ